MDRSLHRCTVLHELLEHHIHEEEDEFFKSARKIFDRENSSQVGNGVHGRKNQACECPNLKTSRPDRKGVLEISVF